MTPAMGEGGTDVAVSQTHRELLDRFPILKLVGNTPSFPFVSLQKNIRMSRSGPRENTSIRAAPSRTVPCEECSWRPSLTER